jgi:predicted adenine nucleotide alpha hydrolase (AANH) superfamily ATPase
MKNIIHEQLKEQYNDNPYYIRYIKENNKLYVIFYNFDNIKNEVEYETRGEIEINKIKQFI